MVPILFFYVVFFVVAIWAGRSFRSYYDGHVAAYHAWPDRPASMDELPTISSRARVAGQQISALISLFSKVDDEGVEVLRRRALTRLGILLAVMISGPFLASFNPAVDSISLPRLNDPTLNALKVIFLIAAATSWVVDIHRRPAGSRITQGSIFGLAGIAFGTYWVFFSA